MLAKEHNWTSYARWWWHRSGCVPLPGYHIHPIVAMPPVLPVSWSFKSQFAPSFRLELHEWQDILKLHVITVWDSFVNFGIHPIEHPDWGSTLGTDSRCSEHRTCCESFKKQLRYSKATNSKTIWKICKSHIHHFQLPLSPRHTSKRQAKLRKQSVPALHGGICVEFQCEFPPKITSPPISKFVTL